VSHSWLLGFIGTGVIRTGIVGTTFASMGVIRTGIVGTCVVGTGIVGTVVVRTGAISCNCHQYGSHSFMAIFILFALEVS